MADSDFRQPWWEQENWDVYGRKIELLESGEVPPFEVSHIAMEDLRKRIFLFWTGGFNYTEQQYQGMEYAPISYSVNPGAIRFRRGTWIVSRKDVSGKWYLWVNHIDITNAMAAFNNPPPENIHPEPNVWITYQGWWDLYADKGKYYQWDMNAPFVYAHHSAVGNQTDETLAINLAYHDAWRWLPRQTDPKEQHPPLVYHDDLPSQQIAWQYREKVLTDRKFISQPDTLGAIFGALFNWWGQLMWKHDGTPVDTYAHYKRFDHWGLKPIYGVAGSQYANGGGIEQNSPGFGTLFMSLFPDRLPQSGAMTSGFYLEWLFNPKTNRAYQNAVEMLLSGMGSRYPVEGDDVFEDNFRTEYDMGSDDLNTNQHWTTHPHSISHLWGENEAPMELFLKKRGRYDWYFDPIFPYVPSLIVHQIAYELGSGTKTWEEEVADFDLGDLVGTWRRTWKETMGRPCPFMRSQEMGEPNRQDDWNPLNESFNWFGARSMSYPRIYEFDDKFKAIAERLDDYTFGVSSDITDDLQLGWMVHLCDSASDRIANAEGEYLPFGFVTKIWYDSEKGRTYIRLNVSNTGRNIMGWNKEVSLRHDPSQVSFKTVEDELKIYPEYTNVHRIIYECREMLVRAKYREAALSITLKSLSILGRDENVPEDSPEPVALLGASNMWAIYNGDPDSELWEPTLGGVYALTHVQGIRASEYDPWQWVNGHPYGFLAYSQGWVEVAFKVEGDEESVIALHGNVNVRISYTNMLQPENPPYYQQPCQVGFGSIVITQGVDTSYPQADRYAHVGCRVYKYGSGRWAKVRILNGLPGMLYSYMNPNVYPNCWVDKKGEYMLDFLLSTEEAFIELHWDNVPESAFERCLVGHVDVAEPFGPDTKPPRPNPPFHATQPTPYFKYIEAEDSMPEHFELRITGRSGICEDYESPPVKYRAFSKYGSPRITDFLLSTRWDVFVRIIPIQDAVGYDWQTLDNAATENPAGSVTRITFANSGILEVGDEIKIRGTIANNGLHTVTAVDGGGTWFEFDEGIYLSETIPADAELTLLDKCYGWDEWAVEPCRLWEFAVQAKDSAQPQNNMTKLSEYKQVGMPDEFPKEIYDRLFDDDPYQPPD